MKRSKFSEERIVYALKQQANGKPVLELCRELGVTDKTFYNWKKRYGDMGTSEVRELKQLRDENNKLKRLVADLTLDKQILQDVIAKKI
jgi:putative transposase